MSELHSESTQAGMTQISVQKPWWGHLLWVIGGAILSMVVAAIFTGIFRLPRALYLVPYVVLVGALLYSYVHWSKLNVKQLFGHNWVWGLVGAVVVGCFAVQSVLHQPLSPPPQGYQLVFDILWLGLAYGAVDGLLLSVLPVVAVWHAATNLGVSDSWSNRTGVGILALVASLAIIAVYHLGYPEFRGPQVLWPMFGVGVMTLAYLITGNPLSAILSHIAMHVTAVLYGLQTAMQLPPHY